MSRFFWNRSDCLQIQEIRDAALVKVRKVDVLKIKCAKHAVLVEDPTHKFVKDKLQVLQATIT